MTHDAFANQSPAPRQVVPPPRSQSGSGGTATIIIVILGVGLLAVLICGGIALALLLPAVSAARTASYRAQGMNNLKQIGLALHNYQSANGHLPPAYTVDEDGRPLHSWRTLILPFLGHADMYEQIDLDKAWNDPVNVQFGLMHLAEFAHPDGSTAGSPRTCYQLIEDPSAMMYGTEQRRLVEVTDGTANTVMVIETPTSDSVYWMQPQDLPLKEFLILNPSNPMSPRSGFNILMGDGSVRLMPASTPREVRKALVTRDGGEPIEPF